MRWAERGISPVKASLIGILLFAIGAYFIFTKALPFTFLSAVVMQELGSNVEVRLRIVDKSGVVLGAKSVSQKTSAEPGRQEFATGTAG